MKLSFIKESPDDALNLCERRVNNGSESHFTELFLPCGVGNPFTCAKFDISVLTSVTENIRKYGELPLFCSKFCGENKIYVHPDLAGFYPNLDIQRTEQVVIPTSSSRTVKLCGQPFYLKLCYPGRIGRVTRELDERHIYSSLDVTECFDRLAIHKDASEKFAFMPERGGILYSNGDDIKIGIVIRSQIAVGKNTDKIFSFIPGFSLFSTDRDCPSDESLLLQLIREKCTGGGEVDYVLNEFCYPLIDIFFNCVILEGIVPEMHSQNILLGFDKTWNLVSIVLRDLESHDKDITLMQRLGKPGKPRSYPFKCIEYSQYNYAIKHSFMFDHKLGEYFILKILEIAANGNGQIFNKMCSILKCYVLNHYGYFINGISFFPSDGKWYKFKNVIVDRTLESRPYDILDNPLFR
jgi:hypothetical protein